MNQAALHADEKYQKNLVLKKALSKVVEQLALSRKELSLIVGPSEASLSRFYNQSDYFIDCDTKEGQLAVLLIRVYQSLDALFGGNKEQYRLWLRSNNQHLEGIPVDLLQTISGLIEVIRYLEAVRGKH